LFKFSIIFGYNLQNFSLLKFKLLTSTYAFIQHLMVLLPTMRILTEFKYATSGEERQMVCQACPGWRKDPGGWAGGRSWWEVRRCCLLKLLFCV